MASVVLGLVPAPASASSFSDIADSPFVNEIIWMADAGITTGCGGGRFCPKDSVTRGEMASFVARAFALPPATRDYFSDDEGLSHEDNINRMAEAGITIGCSDTAFCPRGLVSRGQMASFLDRALGLPAATADHFTDDDGTAHEQAINRIAEAGITTGCGTNRFCPNGLVNRQQMAAFLYRVVQASVPTPIPTANFPPETTLRYVATPNLPLPGLRQPITDRTFGTQVTRITEAGRRHGYSRRQPWSPDERYLLIEKGGAQLLDGQTYAFIKNLSGVPGGPQWISNTELIGVSTNRLITLNVETGIVSTEFTFTGYTAVTMGGEGRHSDDGRYFALAGTRTGGTDLIVYDRTRGTFASTPLPASPNFVTMSRTGQYVIVGNNVRGTARGQGTELFNASPLSFVRSITDNYSHSDPGLDVDGADVLAMCGQEYPRLYLLDAGGERSMSPFPTAFGTSHVAAFGPTAWATYSNYKPDASLRPGADQVASMKMDGSGKARVWAHIHNVYTGIYDHEPQAVISPSGTRVLFASNWGTSSVYDFVAAMPGN